MQLYTCKQPRYEVDTSKPQRNSDIHGHNTRHASTYANNNVPVENILHGIETAQLPTGRAWTADWKETRWD